LSPLDWRSARVHQPISLLAEVLLAEVLLAGVLLVAEVETVLAESGLLIKKGTILHELAIPGEEKKVALFSDVLPGTWCSWDPFS
jgi:hypothetical protein